MLDADGHKIFSTVVEFKIAIDFDVYTNCDAL